MYKKNTKKTAPQIATNKENDIIRLSGELQLSRYTPVLCWDRVQINSFWSLYKKVMDPITRNFTEFGNRAKWRSKDGQPTREYLRLKRDLYNLDRQVKDFARRLYYTSWFTCSYSFFGEYAYNIISRFLKWIEEVASLESRRGVEPILAITWTEDDMTTFWCLCDYLSSHLAAAVQPLINKLAVSKHREHAKACRILDEICDRNAPFRCLFAETEWRIGELRRFLEDAQKWCRKFQYFVEDVALAWPMESPRGPQQSKPEYQLQRSSVPTRKICHFNTVDDFCD